jgi:hypothetical protein
MALIRKAEDVLEVVTARGLNVRIDPGPPPMPILGRPHNVPKEMVTDALLDALRTWRLDIIDLLKEKK